MAEKQPALSSIYSLPSDFPSTHVETTGSTRAQAERDNFQ